jgi:hypothetical protein
VIPYGYHEDAVDARVESGCLEIELKAVKLIELQVPEVISPGRYEVLLLWRQLQHATVVQFGEVTEPSTQTPGEASEDRGRERAAIVCAYQMTKRAGPVEFHVVKCRIRIVMRVNQGEMINILDVLEQDPRTESFVVSYKRSGFAHASPDSGATVTRGVHGDNAGSGIPTPEPLMALLNLRIDGH